MPKKSKSSKRKRHRQNNDDNEAATESKSTLICASIVPALKITKDDNDIRDEASFVTSIKPNERNQKGEAENHRITTTSVVENNDNLGLSISLELAEEEEEEEGNEKSPTPGITSHSLQIPKPLSESCLEKSGTVVVETYEDQIDYSLLLQLAKHSFYKMSSKRKKKKKQSSHSSNETEIPVSSWRPTPIQLQSWPILTMSIMGQNNNDHRHESDNCKRSLNIVGISPTGSGKSLSYGIPLVLIGRHTNFVINDCNNSSSRGSSRISGLIITPTRELTIQVAKVISIVCKSSNKLAVAASKGNASNDNDGGAVMNKKLKTVKHHSGNVKVTMTSLAIYGGADKTEQIQSLLGNNNVGDRNDSNSNGIEEIRNIIVTATPGRLVDLLGLKGNPNNDKEKGRDDNHDNDIQNCKNGTPNDDEQQQEATCQQIRKLFQTTKMVIIDEADRIATQSDITIQVDSIFNFVKDTTKFKNDLTVGLFSATLPQRAVEKMNDWIIKPRCIVKVNSVTVGGENVSKTNQNNDIISIKGKKMNGDEDSESLTTIPLTTLAKAKEKHRGPLNLSVIPSHVEQILHVCANHKKPKKLITTIKKIRDNEAKNEEGKRRRRGLIVVFFGTVKTLQYMHLLLKKENVQSVQLHSQMKQERREHNLLLFRSGKCPMLLATDIAARGLHVNNIEYVINYDFPGSLEQV